MVFSAGKRENKYEFLPELLVKEPWEDLLEPCHRLGIQVADVELLLGLHSPALEEVAEAGDLFDPPGDVLKPLADSGHPGLRLLDPRRGKVGDGGHPGLHLAGCGGRACGSGNGVPHETVRKRARF